MPRRNGRTGSTRQRAKRAVDSGLTRLHVFYTSRVNLGAEVTADVMRRAVGKGGVS